MWPLSEVFGFVHLVAKLRSKASLVHALVFEKSARGGSTSGRPMLHSTFGAFGHPTPKHEIPARQDCPE